MDRKQQELVAKVFDGNMLPDGTVEVLANIVNYNQILYLFFLKKNKTKRQPAPRRHCGRKYSNHDGCDKETDGTDKGCDKDCHKRNNDDNVEVGVITIIDDNRRRKNICLSIILNLPALVNFRFFFEHFQGS